MPHDPRELKSAPPYRVLLHGGLVAAGCWLFFAAVFARPLFARVYLAESDLYEYYLPLFLAPPATWSSFEFSGLPAFADPGDFTAYPLHFLFAHVFGSWTGLIISAHVLAASFTYAYVYHHTRSRTAAAISGLAYGFSEAMIERTPHLGTLHAFAWLPLIALSIDKLRGAHPRRWIAIGAFALANNFLAGHPQAFVYTTYCAAAYAVGGGVAERAGRGYAARVAGLFVLAALLSAIKMFPLVEASLYVARQEVGYGQFVSHSNTPREMLSMLFPTVLHDGREAPTYVGLATLLLAGIGAVRARREWRPAFWIAAAVLALLLGMGPATPVATIAYAVVPLYMKFRIVARHLFIAAFGAAVLAGYGIAAVQQGWLSRARAGRALAVYAAVVAAGALLLATLPGVQFENRAPLPWTLPIWHSGVWIQLGIALLTMIVVAGFASGRRRAVWAPALLLVLAIDLLYAQPNQVTLTGLNLTTIPAEAVEPSVHTLRLASTLAPGQQRLLSIGGTGSDAVAPGAFARLWRIPIAGGYGPMEMLRYSDLALMGTNGAVSRAVLADSDAALDLLAVKYVLVKPDDAPAPQTFDRNGMTWSREPLDLSIGRDDCSVPYSRSLSLPLPDNVAVSSVSLVAHLRCAENALQGQEVDRIEAVAQDGTVHGSWSLHAGVEIAEQGLADPALRARARHQAPPRFDPDPAALWTFETRLDLVEPIKGGHIEIEDPSMQGWTVLDKLTLVDTGGHPHPQTAVDLFLHDARRWREVEQFSTSRETDRGADVDAGGEERYTVYENLRALPRAWVASAIKALPEHDLLAAVRHSRLPDGTRFDPRTTALVDEGRLPQVSTFPQGDTSAPVRRIDDSSVTVDVSTAGGGMLVLSDVWYPGWRARVDDTPATVLRADGALRGVIVPPGRHTVVFELVSPTRLAGAGTSLLGVAIGLVLLVSRRRGTSLA